MVYCERKSFLNERHSSSTSDADRFNFSRTSHLWLYRKTDRQRVNALKLIDHFHVNVMGTHLNQLSNTRALRLFCWRTEKKNKSPFESWWLALHGDNFHEAIPRLIVHCFYSRRSKKYEEIAEEKKNTVEIHASCNPIPIINDEVEEAQSTTLETHALTH